LFVTLTAASSVVAAGKDAPKTCTFEMCVASAIKHGHAQPVAARWCTDHMQIGDACKNVGK
jgi:hypothetical protein